MSRPADGTTLEYPGRELDVFREARNWKRRLGRELAGFVTGDVLEVGAGIGATTAALQRTPHRSWVCLEPDPGLATRLREALPRGAASGGTEVVTGTLEDLDADRDFDAVLYVDVLEHVEDDRGELARAARRLRPGGRLAVLAPAHPWLFTPFDEAVGHHRRYTRASLLSLEPPGLAVERVRYLDAAGLLASLANRLFLRSADPSLGQVQTWDRLLVPVSRWLDPVLGYRVGKSVLAVWRRST